MATGNRQQATGNRQQATGNRQHSNLLTLSKFFALTVLVFSLVVGVSMTAYATPQTWSGNITITSTQTIDDGVTLDADITLTINNGVTLTVKRGIIGDKTLTVTGGGTLIVYGSNGSNGNDGGVGGEGGPGIHGNIIVSGASVTVTGGAGGNGGSGVQGGNGGTGGYGVSGTVTVNSGSITVTGGSGGTGGGGAQNGNGGNGGCGVSDAVTVNSGSITVTGGSGGTRGGYGSQDGNAGQAVSGTITGTPAKESTDNSNWSDITSGTSSKKYVKVGGPSHTHSFTYSASGATITATCGGTGSCDITEGLTLTVSAPTGDLVYDGTTTYPATLSTGYDTTAFPDTYSISYTKDGSAYSGEPKDAGAYTASVTAGTGDAAKTASVSYTVAQADDPNYKVPTGLTATYGQTLKDVTLPTGWKWEDPDTTSVGAVGENSFKATFTPTDTANYKTVTGVSVKVTVKAKAESSTDKEKIVIGDKDSDAKSVAEYVNDPANADKLQEVTQLELTESTTLTDLTGIEKLTKLQKLNVSGSTSLETADLSKNKELSTVDLSNCASLKTVDVSGCQELVSLDVSSGDIEKLNVSGCPNLKYLDCSLNSLLSLDLSGFDNLSFADCHSQDRGGLTSAQQSDGTWKVALPDGLATGTVRVAAAGFVVDSVKVYDKDGNLMTATAAGTYTSQPKTVKYDYNTGYKDVLMDVTLTGSGATPAPDGPTSSKGSGGCDAGFGGLLALSALALLRSRRR